MSENFSAVQQQSCSCTATANLALMRKELERYKAMYERERDQFEEFQRYSKELESEMELELVQRDRRLTELEAIKGRQQQELEMIKAREEQQRRDQNQVEEHLKAKFVEAEKQTADLKHRLRAVEQANDDMERRERIHSQQLVDICERYDKCLERCALLETGMLSPNSQPSPFLNGELNNGIASFGEEASPAMDTDSRAAELIVPPMTIQDTASQMAANRESNKLIENMLRKIEAVESQYLNNSQNGTILGSSTCSTPLHPVNGHSRKQNGGEG